MPSRSTIEGRLARAAVDSFALALGVRCLLLTRDDGKALYAQSPQGADCTFCERLRDSLQLTGLHCRALHAEGVLASERFGGRYTYFCPLGLAFCAAPVIEGGRTTAALIAGPVRITETDDVLESDALPSPLPAAIEVRLRNGLERVPAMTPQRLHYLSGQLFASAVVVSDSSHEVFLSQSENDQQNYIGSYIAGIKRSARAVGYPMAREQALYEAVARGDSALANELLGQLLGYIFFYIRSETDIMQRVQELLVIISRAAIAAGAGSAQVFELSDRCREHLRLAESQSDLTARLSRTMNHFLRLVIDLGSSGLSDAVQRAIEFLSANYAQPLTLEDAAAAAGYSPTYFSRVFREETGITYRAYLNRIRIERSKLLLLSGPVSVAEVCQLVGFSDQSYFCKVFRELEGVSPDRFRKRSRRIDTEKEHGGCADFAQKITKNGK